MIYDTFLFGDELDMLECRLTELEQYPDVRHVLVEAALDHQGNPKPLYYAEHKERFAPWADRVTHVVADLPEQVPNPWFREYAQRLHVWPGIAEADPDDVVLLCDVDEIPSPAAMAIRPEGMVALNMNLAMFAVDWVHPEPARIAVAGRRKDLPVQLWLARNNAPRSIFPLIYGCGWHFTWLGGPDAIRSKASRTCHIELQRMIIESNEAGLCYERGLTWCGAEPYPPERPAIQLLPAAAGESWPVYIRERRCPPQWFRPRKEEL